MTIPVELDQKTESALRAQAIHLRIQPNELAGELLKQVVDNHALLVALSERSSENSMKEPISTSQGDQTLRKLFSEEESGSIRGQIVQFGMFRGQLGELSDEEFKRTEFVDQ